MHTTTVHTETHHMVDDAQPAEQAISRFIQLCPYTRYQRFDGMVVYAVMHLAFAESRLKEAEKIIKDNHLPLVASLKKSAIDGAITITAKQ